MAQRKLLSEVDRTLKKVSEGVELFESMYDKLQVNWFRYMYLLYTQVYIDDK